MPEGLIDRLLLTDERIEGMAKSIDEVIDFKDPVGKVLSMEENYAGLLIGKKTVPMGVIAIIYESRPNVTLDAAILSLKASSAIILRGGKESIKSNIAIADAIRLGIKNAGYDEDFVQIVKDTSRESSKELMQLKGYVDLLLPRGSASLINSVVENAKVPVIETGVGNCHIYVDDMCDIENAVRAEEDDYGREYLDYEVSVKTVDDVDAAIDHITRYSTGHSESILTESYERAMKFLEEVDSACVYVNASTRFTDGGEFGKGAELGISTQKLHARGPVGLDELVSYKYIIFGHGEYRK